MKKPSIYQCKQISNYLINNNRVPRLLPNSFPRIAFHEDFWPLFLDCLGIVVAITNELNGDRYERSKRIFGDKYRNVDYWPRPPPRYKFQFRR